MTVELGLVLSCAVTQQCHLIGVSEDKIGGRTYEHVVLRTDVCRIGRCGYRTFCRN